MKEENESTQFGGALGSWVSKGAAYLMYSLKERTEAEKRKL